MKIERDYEEFLRLLNKNKVKYCIVGAYAVTFYSRPRYTKDLDILVEPEIENAKRIVKVLQEFGFGGLKLSEKDFCKKNQIVQLGYEPVRIDLITSIPGSTFERVWRDKRIGRYGDERVFFIGEKELIRSKKRTRRKQDLLDVEFLSSAKRRKKK